MERSKEPGMTENVFSFVLGEGNRPLGTYIYGQRIWIPIISYNLLCTSQRWQQERTTPVSGLGESFYNFLGRSVHCDPRFLSLCHTIFTCNFVTLAILDKCLCNMLHQKLTNKAHTLWNKRDLAWYELNSCKPVTNMFHL